MSQSDMDKLEQQYGEFLLALIQFIRNAPERVRELRRYGSAYEHALLILSGREAAEKEAGTDGRRLPEQTDS